MKPIEKVLAKLPNAKRSGDGWTDRCPAHDDQNPSLSIAEADDGRVLLHCHGGCELAAVIAKLRLTIPDLFPNGDHFAPTSGKPRDVRSHGSKPAPKALRSEKPRGPSRIAATYDYRDEHETLVFQVVRFEPKKFKQRRPDGTGGWIWNLEGCRGDLLYRLPKLLAALAENPGRIVFIVEGEKDVESLTKMDVLAACNAGGAEKWIAEHAAFLRDCVVVILPDNDDRGRKHAEAVAASVKDFAKSVRIVELPDLPEKGDVSDWIAGGGTKDSLLALVQAEPEWTQPAFVSSPTGPRAVAVRYSEIEAKSVPWLWEGRIARGMLTLLVGRPGCGKSFLACDLAARVSTGTPFADGSVCERGSVILTNFEDAPEYVTKARLTALGADETKVLHLTEIEEADGSRRPVGADDIAAIEQEVRRRKDVRLLIIDPAGDWIGGSADTHRDNDVRARLGPLAALAERTELAVVIVMHCRKSGGTTADDTALGSVGFVGKARSVLHLSHDPEDEDRRLLAAGKSNLGEKAPTLAFTIGGDPARVQWEREPDPRSADEIAAQIASAGRGGKEPSKREDAVEWLREHLGDGPLPVTDVENDAKRDGIAKRTLDRARKALGVVSRPDGFGGSRLLVLPCELQSPPSESSVRQVETLAETEGPQAETEPPPTDGSHEEGDATEGFPL